MTAQPDIRRDFTADAWARAFNGGDVEWIMQFVAADATYVNRRLGIDIAGRDGWRELLEQIKVGLPKREVVVRRHWSGADHFAMEIDYSVAADEPVEVQGIRLGAGERFVADVLILVEVRDGLISAQRDYWAE